MGRPKIKNIGWVKRPVKWNDLKPWLYDNYAYPQIVSISDDTLTYKGHILFKLNKENPPRFFITVSEVSKLIIDASIEGINRHPKDIDELKDMIVNYRKWRA